jgi:hypothetical protein
VRTYHQFEVADSSGPQSKARHHRRSRSGRCVRTTTPRVRCELKALLTLFVSAPSHCSHDLISLQMAQQLMVWPAVAAASGSVVQRHGVSAALTSSPVSLPAIVVHLHSASIHHYRAPAQLESTQRSVDAVQLQCSSSPCSGAFANSAHISASSQLPRGNRSTWRQHLPCGVGKRQFLRFSARLRSR